MRMWTGWRPRRWSLRKSVDEDGVRLRDGCNKLERSSWRRSQIWRWLGGETVDRRSEGPEKQRGGWNKGEVARRLKKTVMSQVGRRRAGSKIKKN